MSDKGGERIVVIMFVDREMGEIKGFHSKDGGQMNLYGGMKFMSKRVGG